MVIRKYTPADADNLFTLIKREGDEWEYWQGANRTKYQTTLDNCIVYLVFEGDVYPYYEKLGYEVEGKIYKVKSGGKS